MKYDDEVEDIYLGKPIEVVQEAFDTVVRHLHSMKRPAAHVYHSGLLGNCRYRYYEASTNTTFMCAIGCLIPDEVYTSRFENTGFLFLLDQPSCSKYVEPLNCRTSPYDTPLGSALQMIHDISLHWNIGVGLNAQGVARLRLLAVKYHLSLSVFEECGW